MDATTKRFGKTGKRQSRWRTVPGRAENLRGPLRAVTLEEQLEIQRAILQGRAERRTVETAAELADRYGVSMRTVYRYAQLIAVPQGLEYLTVRVKSWAAERDLGLTGDDIATLMYLVSRHRDFRPEPSQTDWRDQRPSRREPAPA